MQETSTDSDKIINEQIQATLEFINKLEQGLKDDVSMFQSDDPFSPERIAALQQKS